MPVSPSTWITNNPITAHQLNNDLYSIDGSYFNANGTMFHSNRPLLIETYTNISTFTIPAPVGGRWTVLGGVAGNGISLLDNAALYGSGADGPGDAAKYQSAGAVAPGSSGISGVAGGWNLVFSFIPLGPFTGTNSAFAAGWYLNQTALQAMGPIQPGSALYQNCGFAVDLVDRVQLQSGTLQTAAFALDPAGRASTIASNISTTTGITPRLTELWCGVNNGNGNLVTAVPSPMTAITGTTPLTSADFNTTIQQTFDLLNYPPMLHVEENAGGTFSGGVTTTVSFISEAPLVDNYSGFSAAAGSTYSVPLPGLYFCHATVPLEPTGGIAGVGTNVTFSVGFLVNGTEYHSGWYNVGAVTSMPYGAAATKILDLHAGDQVSAFVRATAEEQLNFAGTSTVFAHFTMVWLGSISTGIQHWSPPEVTGFQFQAATPPGPPLNPNPFFTSSAGWGASNGSFTVSSSPPAGAPYPDAGLFTVSSTAGASMNQASAPFAVTPASQYALSAWVWTPSTVATIGFNWNDPFGSYISTGWSSYPVPASTWWQVTTMATAPAGAGYAYPVLAPKDTVNSSLYATAVQAGLGQPLLAPLLHSKVVNDVNFLLQRPYLLSYQSTAQTGLSASTNFYSPAMQSVGGLVHGSLGDNYGGWSAAGNCYAAPVAGWYLALAEVAMSTVNTGGTGTLVAGFSVPTSGGVTSPVSPQGQPDWYQALRAAANGTWPTGATAIGCYYLLPGETIAPSAWYRSTAPTTWNTDVTHSFPSHFECIWVSN